MIELSTGVLVISSFAKDVLARDELPDPDKVWGRIGDYRATLLDPDEIVSLANNYSFKATDLLSFMMAIPSDHLFWTADFLHHRPAGGAKGAKTHREYLEALSLFVSYSGPQMFSQDASDYISDRLIFYAGLGFRPGRPLMGPTSFWERAVLDCLARMGPDWGPPA